MSGEPEQEECPLCERTVERLKRQGYPELLIYNCPHCGRFAISNEVREQIGYMEAMQRAHISAYTRANTIRGIPTTILLSSRGEWRGRYPAGVLLEDVLDGFPKTIAERLDTVLMNLAKLSPQPGIFVSLSDHDEAVLYAENKGTAVYLAEALEAAGLVEKTQLYALGMQLRLTPSGWNRVAEIQRTGPSADSQQVFVAMWFDEEVQEAYEAGIKPAIENAGFDALRIDLKEHNQKICDLIIAEIRKSRFVVADVTGQRQGVYFEGGFAMGLGIRVIWMCRQDEIDKCHFDTRQYNHVVWERPEDLHQKLLRRIQATIPQASTGSS